MSLPIALDQGSTIRTQELPDLVLEGLSYRKIRVDTATSTKTLPGILVLEPTLSPMAAPEVEAPIEQARLEELSHRTGGRQLSTE